MCAVIPRKYKRQLNVQLLNKTVFRYTNQKLSKITALWPVEVTADTSQRVTGSVVTWFEEMIFERVVALILRIINTTQLIAEAVSAYYK